MKDFSEMEMGFIKTCISLVLKLKVKAQEVDHPGRNYGGKDKRTRDNTLGDANT